MGLIPNILGICGAPCTGKTTLANALWNTLTAQGVNVTLLGEPARRMVARGVNIDQAMSQADYDAFLRAYRERDRVPLPLCIADRTPLDHLSYIEANQNMPQRELLRHRRAVNNALERYRLLFYLPIEFALSGDSFRMTSVEYQHVLDAAIRRLVGGVPVAVVAIKGPLEERIRQALHAMGQAWPGLLERKVLV